MITDGTGDEIRAALFSEVHDQWKHVLAIEFAGCLMQCRFAQIDKYHPSALPQELARDSDAKVSCTSGDNSGPARKCTVHLQFPSLGLHAFV
ncbi:hypothetical protein GCM10023165_20730 [Variovorax defluvii]|uniref:Uncharacterized protein n=1 Tax=Variovorax defluvii TaxID=913761 RepID=A0ABP8HKI2_9BURK